MAKTSWTCAAALAAYVFLNTVTFRLGSHGGGAYLAAPQQELMYYVHQVFYVLGLLSFPLARRVLRGGRGQRTLTAGALLAYAVCAAALLFGRGVFVYYCAASGAVFCLGFLGGRVCLRASAASAAGVRVGACMGVGFAAAYALQYLLQLWRGASPLLPLAMLAALAALAWLLPRGADAEKEPGRAAETRGRVPMRSLVCVCVVTAALVLLNCFFDGYIERLQVATGYETYSAFGRQRLLLVPGCLLFGLLGDARGGRYMPLAVLCAALPAMLSPVLTGTPGMYRLNLCLFYVGVAAMASYLHLAFWRLAPKTGCPALWACFGRALEGTVGVAAWLAGLSRFSAAAVLAVEAASLAALLAAMAVDGQLDLSDLLRDEAAAGPVPTPAGGVPPSAAEPPDADPVAALRDRCGLTPREAEVLRALLTSDGDQQQIAGELHITVSTLQHHTTSIYRKTGAESRAGLYRLCYGRADGEA